MIIVTADHSHSLTINGHAERGADILGVASTSKTEGTPYTTLTYGTSYKGFQVDANGKRVDPTTQDTTAWAYTQQAAINTDQTLPVGSDVTIPPKGAPMLRNFNGGLYFNLVFFFRRHGLLVSRRTRTKLCGACDFVRASHRPFS